MNPEDILRKMQSMNPSEMTSDSLTQEEWAILHEYHNELKMETFSIQNEIAMRQAVNQWVQMTALLPDGLLNASEKVELIHKVLGRMPKGSGGR